MKNFIFIIVFFILIPSIYSDNIEIDYSLNTPIGSWASEMHNGYGFGVNYLWNYKYIDLIIGMEIQSFTTYNYLYRINFLKIPMGISKNIYKNSNLLLDLRLKGGISIIEKRMLENYERGFNEFLSGDLFLSYTINKNSFAIYTGLLKEKIIESKYSIYLGFSFIFNID